MRCKLVVADALDRLGIAYSTIDLGQVHLSEGMTPEQKGKLKVQLLPSGLEVLDNRKSILVEQIKNLIVEMVHYTDELPQTKYSAYISSSLGFDYTYLANIFSEVKHMSISRYIILNKIEKVKELLLYNELNMTEISYKMHYSSVGHMSSQFKKITNVCPSTFKHQNQRRSTGLEQV